ELADDREGLAKRLGERDGDVVAIDVEAAPGGAAVGVRQARRRRPAGVEEGGAELCLAHAVTRSRMRAARVASAARTGQSGTSLSHSMSVGRGPALRIVRA